MGRKFEELLGLTKEIAPSKTERPASRTSTAPGQMIGALTQRDAALERADEAEAELTAIKSVMEIDLDLLVEVPGRRRTLSEEEYADLKNNLRQHPLATPVSVRRMPDGRFEIVSGHNRVAIYRELREEDPARFSQVKGWLDESDAEQTEELAFYANLLHPDLSVWEKYQGFRKIMQTYPEVKSHYDLSDRTGMNRRVVSQIMLIEELPQAARDLMAQKPGAIGYNTIEAMAKAVREGRESLAVEAIRCVIEEGITQQAAIDMVQADAPAPAADKKSTPTKAQNVPVEFKVGRSTFCRYVRNEKRIAINFASAEDAAEVEEAVQAILEQQAERRRAEKKK